MSQKLLKYVPSLEPSKSFTDPRLRDLYQDWDHRSRQTQISIISFLTASLYVIFTLLERSAWVSAEMQTLMMKLHLLIIVPMMLTIGFLAYQQRFYKIVMYALAMSPVVAMTCHTFITSRLDNFAPFLTEGYLMVFWIFIVSGMTFQYALVSAITCSAILVGASYFYIESTAIYTMHVFWVFCSFSLGLFGGLIFDSAKKAIFANLQELQQLAMTDSLTGVFNRNHLNHVLSQEMKRCARYGNPFGLLVIDIDHFKQVNDTYGHHIGDEILQQIARILSTTIRENDALIRWGGEEFIVIALHVNEQSLAVLCEKLRNKIENSDYGKVEKITVSIGATVFSKDDTQEVLIARADRALYTAKEKGRNTYHIESERFTAISK